MQWGGFSVERTGSCFCVVASVSLRGGHLVYLRSRFADRKTQKGVKRLRAKAGGPESGGASVAGIYTPRRRGRSRAIFFQPQPRATPAASVSLPSSPPSPSAPFCPQSSTTAIVVPSRSRHRRLYTERWTNNNKYIFPGRVANPVRGGTSMRARTGIA